MVYSVTAFPSGGLWGPEKEKEPNGFSLKEQEGDLSSPHCESQSSASEVMNCLFRFLENAVVANTAPKINGNVSRRCPFTEIKWGKQIVASAIKHPQARYNQA